MSKLFTFIHNDYDIKLNGDNTITMSKKMTGEELAVELYNNEQCLEDELKYIYPSYDEYGNLRWYCIPKEFIK